MLAAASKTGEVLLTVSEAEELAVAPSLSVRVATHVMGAVGAELLAVRVKLVPLSITVPFASCHS